MCSQERKSGLLQYFLSIAACLLSWAIIGIIGFVIKNQLVCNILYFIASIIIVYNIYVHYCATFLYTVEKKKLTVIRRSGKREIRNIEIPFGRIVSISKEKPQPLPKDVETFTIGVINKKDYYYLVYEKGSKCIIFEPNEDIVNSVKDYLNQKDADVMEGM